MSSQRKIDLSTLNPQQLARFKNQFDQELQHFQQSLQALGMAKSKFKECIQNVKMVSHSSNNAQQLLVPLSASLYVKGRVVENDKYMIDIGTGYYVEKTSDEAIEFYSKRIDKLDTESVQIQKIIAEKSESSIVIENLIRKAAIKQHDNKVNQVTATN